VRRFARLFAELDATTATQAKVAALRQYFTEAPAADAAWAVYFLAGGKPRRGVPSALLAAAAGARAGVAPWLVQASYAAVGDLAETLALILPPPSRTSDLGLAQWIEMRLLPLRDVDAATQVERIQGWWDELDGPERFLLNKLIGGAFRVGVSKLLVQRALAQAAGVDATRIAGRMMGYTDGRALPTAARYAALVDAQDVSTEPQGGEPYPFFLAHPLDPAPETLADRLGAPGDWQVEWKYDGIRAQVVKRDGAVHVWSRGEELVTDRFPEVASLAAPLPDGTVLDGEIVAWRDGTLAPFALLQQRIGRKSLTRRILDDAPATFLAYDLLQASGQDLRDEPLHARRARLEALAATQPRLALSPLLTAPDWEAFATLRAEARARGVEGLMLKARGSRYGAGRRKQADLAGGTWWKWKIDPYGVDAVLIYAQAGHGRRASLYTDYTFAVWSRPPRDADEARAVVDAIARRATPGPDDLQLVPFAKAYSGLTDEEIAAVDRVVRRTTAERFGPVRSLVPSLVFELGFEGISRSGRHRSGIAVRFPRILRRRPDKPLHEADTLATLEALLGRAAPLDPAADADAAIRATGAGRGRAPP